MTKATRLTAGLVLAAAWAIAPAGTADAAGPAGFKVWNGDVVAPNLDWDYRAQPAAGRIAPIKIVATRNGTFSGKIVVGAAGPIRGLRAGISGFIADGGGRIGPDRVKLAFPRWVGMGSWRVTPEAISQFDALYSAPLRVIPTIRKIVKRKPVDTGFACQPIWVIVSVPADARPGNYKAVLRIAASGTRTFRVPVRMVVHPYRLPDPADYQTFVELIESPESVAMRYDAPMWSAKHFTLIGKSFDLLGEIGNRSVYIPLICQTNMGNSQSMVRWIPTTGGKYRYDFSVMDKYLDTVEKHAGKPKIVCLYVWDLFLNGGMFSGDIQYVSQEIRADRLAYKGKGPIVSVLRPGATRPSDLTLPSYIDPASEALWRPLLNQLMARLRKRGLDKAVMLGISTDAIPSAKVVGLFAKLLPGVGWVHQSHSFWGGRDKKIKAAGSFIAYAAIVGGRWATDRPGHRTYGWKQPWVHFNRAMRDNQPIEVNRLLGEMNITGERRGFGRLGADFWPVLKDKRGRRRGRICAGRYPKSFWRNLNIMTTFFAVGPDGAIPTARFELLREGVQECEARIVIDKALTDERQRAKLGPALAKQAQDLLDRRTDALRKGLAGAVSGVQFGCPSKTAYENYRACGWQKLSDELYATASLVVKTLATH